ncbi:MAG: S1C family serine protease [Phascolarctobacterium faecium]
MRWKAYEKTMNIFFCALLGAAVLIGGCSDNNKAEAVKEQKTAAAAQKDASLSGARNTPIVAAAKKVGPAVVGITNKAYVRDIFNRVQLTERGTGSGVIYDKSGLIATNNHVVEGASEIIFSLTDGRSVKGKVLGADAATDLAVVKIDENNLPVADFGDSSTLQVGEPAIAIGNPLGLGSAAVSSRCNQRFEPFHPVRERKFDLIQTDAAINPGTRRCAGQCGGGCRYQFCEDRCFRCRRYRVCYPHQFGQTDFG